MYLYVGHAMDLNNNNIFSKKEKRCQHKTIINEQVFKTGLIYSMYYCIQTIYWMYNYLSVYYYCVGCVYVKSIVWYVRKENKE